MSLRQKVLSMIPAALLSLAPLTALAGPHGLKAHTHGAAQLSIALDGKALRLELELPGDSAFGFEKKPQSKDDQAKVDAALTLLRTKAQAIFALPPDLGCHVTKSEVETHYEGSHGEVHGTYDMTCTKAPAGSTLTLEIFKELPRVREVKVQIVTEGGQRGLTSKPEQNKITL